MRVSTTCSSSAAATSAGAVPTRLPRAGARALRTRSHSSETTSEPPGWQKTISSERGAGERPGAWASRCAPARWPRAAPPGPARLREAAEVLRDSPARLEQARALTDLGAALRRANQRAEARPPLQEGLELAERCSARALAKRARTELRAAGGRSSDPESTGLQQLTASERRVAELAAQGHSNPQIAPALFVTRKTVETHLGHVYRKLDVAGRTGLPRALAEPHPHAGA
jgi:DNA-binding CsgD family transcriptional regulator